MSSCLCKGNFSSPSRYNSLSPFFCTFPHLSDSNLNVRVLTCLQTSFTSAVKIQPLSHWSTMDNHYNSSIVTGPTLYLSLTLRKIPQIVLHWHHLVSFIIHSSNPTQIVWYLSTSPFLVKERKFYKIMQLIRSHCKNEWRLKYNLYSSFFY